jgi:hypothetical protein
MRRNAALVARRIADVLKAKRYPRREEMEQWVLYLAPPQDRRKKPAPSGRKVLVAQLDALCREIVFLRDDATCRRCGQPARDWSHVYTRAKYGVRWDLDNSCCMCRACHCWWHENPVDASAWWKSEIGPLPFAELVIRGNRSTKPDLFAVKAYLEGARKELS